MCRSAPKKRPTYFFDFFITFWALLNKGSSKTGNKIKKSIGAHQQNYEFLSLSLFFFLSPLDFFARFFIAFLGVL
jgi:hypothetical protein